MPTAKYIYATNVRTSESRKRAKALRSLEIRRRPTSLSAIISGSTRSHARGILRKLATNVTKETILMLKSSLSFSRHFPFKSAWKCLCYIADQKMSLIGPESVFYA